MPTKTKTFDCVAMKRKAQKRLRDEYESRKGEFACLADFLNAKADESDIAKAVRAKIGRARSEP